MSLRIHFQILKTHFDLLIAFFAPQRGVHFENELLTEYLMKRKCFIKLKQSHQRQMQNLEIQAAKYTEQHHSWPRMDNYCLSVSRGMSELVLTHPTNVSLSLKFDQKMADLTAAKLYATKSFPDNLDQNSYPMDSQFSSATHQNKHLAQRYLREKKRKNLARAQQREKNSSGFDALWKNRDLARKYEGRSRAELVLIANGMENEALLQRQRM
uniref:Uncharacterized protein n=1 Tax=Glossina pallidipes TaxID=7398 RepID=A0A1A9ZZC8_GLOPL